MQSTGQTSTQARSLIPMHASTITYVIAAIPPVVSDSTPCDETKAHIRVGIRRCVGWRKGRHIFRSMLPRHRLALTLAAVICLPVGPELLAQQCDSPRTALVLSGGGAKGIAHIGTL